MGEEDGGMSASGESICCINCSKSGSPGWSFFNLAQQGGGGERESERERGVVDVQLCRNQVVMIVNAPENFKLSLDDILPCYDPTEQHPFKGGWVAAASKGLLLCTTGKFWQTCYYLCNPVTKQWMALPPAPRVHACVHIGFVFDPCDAHTITGCLDLLLPCSACRFKVVRFHDEHQTQQLQSEFEVETFSSGTGEWTITTVLSPQEFLWGGSLVCFSSLFHNGRLHWLGSRGRLVVYDPYNEKLLGAIRGPSEAEACSSYAFGGVGLCRGSFWLCQLASTSEDYRIWQLMGYGDEESSSGDLERSYWSLQHRFHFREMTGGPRWLPRAHCHTMLAIHPLNPDIVFLQLSVGGKCFVVSCNLRTKKLGRAIGKKDFFTFWGDVFTLVLPH